MRPASSSVRAHLVAVLSIVGVTAFLLLLRDASHVNATTIALLLLLAVLFAATKYGTGPAISASAIGMLSFNFLFLRPYGTLTIAEPENWIAFGTFVVVAVTAGQLSGRARQRAEEALAHRAEAERLYHELQDAFDRASRAEALRQSEQLKTALLDAVTHNLRTPLASIKISVTTLLDALRGSNHGDDDEALTAEGQLEVLEVIDEETDRLDEYIGHMVELARIEAGQMALRRGWISAGEIAEQAILLSVRARSTHRIETSIDPDAPALYADGKALAEVLHLVVDNAAKYSPAGSRIGVEVDAEETGGARFAIEDEGRGIPEELRERVFEKFFRLAPDLQSAAPQPQGTGMGLAIARGIVNAHSGTIRIESGPNGRGTRVVVTIPTGEEALEAAAEDVNAKEAETAP